jgi:quercetin dioxygenase-like cupin family protein
MATSSETARELIEDPVLRMRSHFWTTVEDQHEVLNVGTWVDPGGGVSPHIHPSMEERFEILEGRPQFLAGRRWREAAPGETVVVAPGTRHAFRNAARRSHASYATQLPEPGRMAVRAGSAGVGRHEAHLRTER